MKDGLTALIHDLVWQMDASADRILVEEHGIHLDEARFLMVLLSHQPLTQRAFAERMCYTPAAITRALPDFISKGLMQVQVDPYQPRRNFVTLSTHGEKIARGCSQTLEVAFKELLEELEIDFVQFESTVSKVIFALKEFRGQNSGKGGEKL